MSENTKANAGAVLSPVVHRHWRVPRSLGWVALLAVLAMKFVICKSAEIDCDTAASGSNDAITVLVCERAYVDTGSLRAGGYLAEAHYRLGNYAVASAIASGLIVTTLPGVGLRVLGRLAEHEHRYPEAETYLRQAEAIHSHEGDFRNVARDQQVLITTQGLRYHYGDALRTAADCIRNAHLGHDLRAEIYCHLSVVSSLAKRGAAETAEHEYQLANQLLRGHPEYVRDIAWLEYEHGNILQEQPRSPLQGQYYEAEIASLRKALQLGQRAQIPNMVSVSEINLAYSLIHAGQLDEASQALDANDIHDRTHNYLYDRRRLRADLALHRGDLVTAAHICDELYANPEITDSGDRLEIALVAARTAIAADDLASAERWARHGVDEASKIPAEQRDAELRAWTLSGLREPYELLFAVLVRAGKLGEAVQAFDQWQGHMMFDALLRPEPVAPFDIKQAAARIDSLQGSAPALASNPMLRSEPGDVQIGKVRATELVGLVIANGELWRITSSEGALAITDLGPLVSPDESANNAPADCSQDPTTRNLHQLIEHFVAAPTNATCADKLGRIVLPDSVFHETDVALRVVLDAPLVDLPFAALRHAGVPLIQRRPIVRAPRLFEVDCAPRSKRPAPVVIVADAHHDLPYARDEAQTLAARRGTTALLGAQATRDAVRAAGAGSVLYVAGHAGVDEHGGFLQLADGPLYALELSQRNTAPELVLLSSCASALSNAIGPAGSLVTAFLAAGSTQVVATLRRVSDLGAHELTTAFFAAGGERDPVRALARAQATLVDTPNTDWPSFAVFGREFCVTSP